MNTFFLLGWTSWFCFLYSEREWTQTFWLEDVILKMNYGSVSAFYLKRVSTTLMCKSEMTWSAVRTRHSSQRRNRKATKTHTQLPLFFPHTSDIKRHAEAVSAANKNKHRSLFSVVVRPPPSAFWSLMWSLPHVWVISIYLDWVYIRFCASGHYNTIYC